ncbi:3D domain-containing protein [Burkholderia ubonensis]|uniref:3D domain-containing protein n=1 Tax=Burkholderia ubonensis TaxID=101571 RepID=UPI000A7C9A2F|nr:3D domain-containing protein [Burkholderia ubonensis]
MSVADTVLRWEIQKNSFGDTLPIIPSSSSVQNGRVLYQLKIKVTLSHVSDGTPVSGKSVTIKSSRNGDVLSPSVLSSGADGTALFTLQSRNSGDLQLSVESSDVTADALSVSLKDAWYESTFLITGYNVCDESDFGGQMTNAAGLGDQHRYDFLFSASGVIMQGTGRAINGRYVRFVRMSTTWHLNERTHHRDHIQDPAQVTFAYTNSVQGAFGAVTENHSIAVDKSVIPPHAHVSIDGVGDRYADDKGSAIVGYHIDNFLGAGASVVRTWLHGGVNGTQRRVKYIGG